MKLKQQTMNTSMFLLLFFVLVQQSFRIFSLNIGTHVEPVLDLKVFIVLIVMAYLFVTILTIITTWVIITVTFQVPCYNPIQLQPVFVSYQSISQTIQHRNIYQLLQVVRC